MKRSDGFCWTCHPIPPFGDESSTRPRAEEKSPFDKRGLPERTVISSCACRSRVRRIPYSRSNLRSIPSFYALWSEDDLSQGPSEGNACSLHVFQIDEPFLPSAGDSFVDKIPEAFVLR